MICFVYGNLQLKRRFELFPTTVHLIGKECHFPVTKDGMFVLLRRSCTEILTPEVMEFGGGPLGGEEAGGWSPHERD